MIFDKDDILDKAYHKAFDNLYNRQITRARVPNFDNILQDEIRLVLRKRGHFKLAKMV